MSRIRELLMVLGLLALAACSSGDGRSPEPPTRAPARAPAPPAAIPVRGPSVPPTPGKLIAVDSGADAGE
jgi:hypothetical protein